MNPYFHDAQLDGGRLGDHGHFHRVWVKLEQLIREVKANGTEGAHEIVPLTSYHQPELPGSFALQDTQNPQQRTFRRGQDRVMDRQRG